MPSSQSCRGFVEEKLQNVRRGPRHAGLAGLGPGSGSSAAVPVLPGSVAVVYVGGAGHAFREKEHFPRDETENWKKVAAPLPISAACRTFIAPCGLK